ncbi:MAG: tyrosine-type recombinase/integrase [Mycobacterium sp.]|uniref:tyrosine-type recombinase/integrase n=1 Tax=Mycobacterium sp. TaxID=1785 RepID=UPI003CBA7343
MRGGKVRRRRWAKALSDSGLPTDFKLRELRHTAASLAIRSGANIKALQNMLGHASAGLTLDRYGHLYQSDVRTVWARGMPRPVTYGRSVLMTCNNISGRGRYRTADRWCVNPGQSVRDVSRDAIASPNAQVSGLFVSTASMECRAVCARLGTLLAQRGFDRQARRCVPSSVEPEPTTTRRLALMSNGLR